MRQQLTARNGHTVIIETEPSGSVSLSVGQIGVYVLASLTREESRRVRSMLHQANRELGARQVEQRVKEIIP